MLLLASTDILRITTDSAALVDVHASWADYNAGLVTPSPTNTKISSATTTTIVGSPASTVIRTCNKLKVRNTSTATSVTVTTEIYNGTSAFQLDKRVLGPGGAFGFDEDHDFYPVPTGGPQTRPWFGVMAGAFKDGNPGDLMMEVQRGDDIAATPTGITTAVARCQAFMLPFDLTFNRIRAFGVGALTNVYRVAIYRMSDLANLTGELAFTTAVDTWVSIGSALNVTLSKDTLYFVACGVNATGTTPGVACTGTVNAATTGRVATLPASLPGSMALGSTNYLNGFQFQFATTAGALPNPANTLAAQATWAIGGMPAFWLDSADV